MTLAAAEQLRLDIDRFARLSGDFKLASGSESSVYFDLKRVIQRPQDAQLIGPLLFHLADSFGAEAVGGLEIGGPLLSQLVVSQPDNAGLAGFTVRKGAKDHGTKDIFAEAHYGPTPLLGEGRRVAVVEDVVTSGGSIRTAIGAVHDLGCEVVLSFALVDRMDPRGAWLRDDPALNFIALCELQPDGTLKLSQRFLDWRAGSSEGPGEATATRSRVAAGAGVAAQT